MKENKKNFGFVIEESILNKLQEIANEEERTVASLIRKIILDFLKQKGLDK